MNLSIFRVSYERLSIRVVLHDAKWDDYVALRDNIKAIGVVDQIRGGDGKIYELPPAEYTVDSDKDLVTVRTAVYNVASKVKPSPAVYVTQANGRAWIGLKEL